MREAVLVTGTACAGTASPTCPMQERTALQGAKVAEGTLGPSRHSQSRELPGNPKGRGVTTCMTPALCHLHGSGSAGTGCDSTGCAGSPEEMREGKEGENRSSLVGNSPKENFGGYGLPKQKGSGVFGPSNHRCLLPLERHPWALANQAQDMWDCHMEREIIRHNADSGLLNSS